MNAILAASLPLPAVLEQPAFAGPGRRHHIDTFLLDDSGVERFNQLLSQLGRHRPPLDSDRLVTAARELRGTPGTSAPGCIGQRLRRGVAIGGMIGDPSWEPANDAATVASQVMDYLRDTHDLIPDTLPRVGRLDDAIVIDTVWDRLATEVASYLDFRRLRRVESALRGRSAFTFRRGDWEEARLAEAALAAHQRTVREGSFLASRPALFRIH